MTYLRILRSISTYPCNAVFGVQTRLEFFSGWLKLQKHFPGVRAWSFEFRIAGRQFLNFRRLPEFDAKGAPNSLAVHFGFAFLYLRRPSDRCALSEKILSVRSFPEVFPAAIPVV